MIDEFVFIHIGFTINYKSNKGEVNYVKEYIQSKDYIMNLNVCELIEYLTDIIKTDYKISYEEVHEIVVIKITDNNKIDEICTLYPSLWGVYCEN